VQDESDASDRCKVIGVWCARVAWVLLPVTTGAAFADALNSWSTAPAALAAVLLWGVWAGGLLALLAPRPLGLTFLRIAAPCGVAAVACCLSSTSTSSMFVAIAGVLVAAVLALSPSIEIAAANALAYGDEERYPLHTPTPLLLGPIPLAVAVTGAGATAGPLLLAAGHWISGAVVTIVGLPLAYLLGRSMHVLSKRWFVLVPAGIAVVEPLTLAEPVLVLRDRIAGLGRFGSTGTPRDALDLRVGTLFGGVAIALSEPVGFTRRRGRADAENVEPSVVLLAVVRASTALARASRRRIPTR